MSVNPPQASGQGPFLSDFAALVQNTASSLTNPNRPFDGQRGGLDQQYKPSLNVPSSNVGYMANSLGRSDTNSSHYSRNNGYNDSSHEQQRDRGDNFNRNIYKQEESNRDFPNAQRDQEPPRRDIYKDDYSHDRRDDSIHQEYYPDDTRESYKRDPSLLDRFAHLKSQQKQDRSRDYGNEDNRSSNRYNNPGNNFPPSHQTDSKNDRYEDRPAHLEKSGSDFSRRTDDYSHRSDERIDPSSRRTEEHFRLEQGEGSSRMHQGSARDNKHGSEYIPENKYDNKYGSSQKLQQENIGHGGQQQQQPNFNNNPMGGMRPPFSAQQSLKQNSIIPQPQNSNQFSGPPGVYNPSPIPPPSRGAIPPFQKHSQQPPLDFSKPPPGFNGPPPDFNKPPPGFNGGPLPDFTKPPPGFPGGPPPDFSKPPPNFQMPPPGFQGNNQQPPPNIGPVGNFPPRHPASSSGPQTFFQNSQSYGNLEGNNHQVGFPNRPPFQQQNPSDRFDYEQAGGQRYPDQQNPESLGNEDYSKIAQALQTIQSTNYDQTDEGSQYGGSQHEKEIKEKEKKSKKHKKHKKKEKKKEKKEKEIKRRLEEKLAELASLNNDDTMLQQEIGEKPPGSLSIQIKQPQSKFNLKIESPLMRGNIFQKYKDKKDSPLFAGKDHGERNYRRIADQQEDEDSDTDLEEEKQKANENEPQNKEELLQMLDLKQTAATSRPELGQDDALYSGSEEGEVVSDEEELAERKRLKDMVNEAKNEVMHQESEFQPQSELPSSDIQPPVKVRQPHPKKKVEKHPDSDGELSSDGEVSSDGELSDDSVDEFGRLKKFRSEPERISDDDRKYKYSSGSDSDTDEEKERWSKVQTE